MRYCCVLFFIALSILFACNYDENLKIEGENIYVINFEQCISDEHEIRFSEIVDTLEYLELKTPKDVIISGIMKVEYCGNFIIIRARNSLYKFTRDGQFVRQIGVYGQGPDEYTSLFDFTVDSLHKEIVLEDVNKFIIYNYDGDVVRTEQRNNPDWDWIDFSDSILWIGSNAPLSIQKYSLYGLNYQRDTVVAISNPMYGVKTLNGESVYYVTSTRLRVFYQYEDNLFFKGQVGNDTVFRVSGKGIEPHIIFNMGKYKLPKEYESWYSWENHNKYGAHYWGIPYLCEDDRYIYFFAERYRPIDGNVYSRNPENSRYMMYDKQTGKGFVLRNQIIDDITNGPSYWPDWIIDGNFIKRIEWYNLSEEIEQGDYIVTPAAQEQFAKFSNATNELMILGRKKIH